MSTDNVKDTGPGSIRGPKCQKRLTRNRRGWEKGGNNYSRPRKRAIAVVSRLTVLAPPTLFDRGRIGGRKGKNWTACPDAAVEKGEFSFVITDALTFVSSVDESSGKMGRMYSAMIGRTGDGGGIVGSGFEEGYAGGGSDGEGRGGRGGAIMVAMLDSECIVWTVMFVHDVEGWWDIEALRGGKERAPLAGVGSRKHDAQQTSSKASNGLKRSCVSRDARRAGSNSKGSRE
jgi:hypothetical protein